MGTATANSGPAYLRIKQQLLRSIERGELQPGDPVGSERDLARKFNVSVMTARHALKELEIDGVVARRNRVGTFVAPPKIQFNKLLGFSELMASRGFTAYSRLLSVKTIKDESEISSRLALPNRSSLIRVERLRLANTQPFALETCYLSAAQFAGLAESDLDRRSLFAVLEQDFGIGLAYADEEVDATSADPRSAELLGVQKGSPLLRIRQLLFTEAGKPAVYTPALYRSEQHSLLIRRFR